MKNQLTSRLLSTVGEYNTVLGAPIPLKILSAKFGKAAIKVGGFQELVDELIKEERLIAYLAPSGGKLLTLPSFSHLKVPDNHIRIPPA